MPAKSAHVPLLQAGVKALHQCEVTHLETVPVHETFEGQTIWKGEVEVFELQQEPKPARCYAWWHHVEGKGMRQVALIEKWPVVSPETAVRAAIALDIPNKGNILPANPAADSVS